ncbi:MAG TPA: tetratricopeptide repeat protein [Candidatus Limnocylindria bacterium]|nr:tetratricopeptide repeat protein [Candidatus Limnocylindria bacterium]
MSPSADAGLRVRALADQAVAAALDADWPRAIELNTKILEAAPDDVDARNRLGRALLEQGSLDEAKAAFAEVLKAEPYNSIAIRGSQRIAQLQEHNGKAVATTTKTQPRLFIEDMGKTGILRLINPAPAHILARYSAGAECQLREQEGLLAVHARDGELLGFLEPKVGRRLIDLIRTGNQYVAAIVSNDQANARVAIREVFQSAENASRISFPGHHRPAETKERAYIKGNFFRFGSDADEELEDIEEGVEDEAEAATGEEVLEEAESVEEPLVVGDDEDDAEDEEDE